MIRELLDGEYLVLDEWLARATKGLSEEAAARVSEDIREHYDESVRTLTEQGLRPGAAELEAIKRLGSPYKARRGYRREYPTTRDMRALAWYEEEMASVRAHGLWPIWREWSLLLCFGVFAFGAIVESSSNLSAWILPLIALFLPLSWLCTRVEARLAQRRGIRHAYEFRLRSAVVVGSLFLVVASAFALITGFVFLTAVYLFIFATQILWTLLWWRRVKPFLSE